MPTDHSSTRGRVRAVTVGAVLVVLALVGVGLAAGLLPRGGSVGPGEPTTTVSLRVRAPWNPTGAPSGACAEAAAVAADPTDVPAEGAGFAARATAPTTMTYAPQSGCTASGLIDSLRPGRWTVSVGSTACELELPAGSFAVDLTSCRVTPA